MHTYIDEQLKAKNVKLLIDGRERLKCKGILEERWKWVTLKFNFQQKVSRAIPMRVRLKTFSHSEREETSHNRLHICLLIETSDKPDTKNSFSFSSPRYDTDAKGPRFMVSKAFSPINKIKMFIHCARRHITRSRKQRQRR